MNAEKIALDKIVLDPSNARKHPIKNIETIKGSLLRFGQQKPIVIDEKNVVIAGNGTVEAAREIGWTEIGAVRSTLKGIDRTAYAIADNRSTDLGEWDNAVLGEQLESLKMDDFDLSQIGFDDVDLSSLVPEPEYQGKTDDDAIPESVEPTCKTGQLWKLGDHRLLCGDCTDSANVERLMDGEKADMVFTDPPYGMNLDTDFSKMGKPIPEKGVKLSAGYADVIGDNTAFDPVFIFDFFNCNEIFLFGADYYAEKITHKNNGSWVVWDKRCDEKFDPSLGSNFELCWSKQRHKREIARIRWTGVFGTETQDIKKRIHPTQKPIQLAEWFFERWGKNTRLVWDGFLGSGSTLIACEKTGRKCYGMEIDPGYCDVIIKRWEDYTGKKSELVKDLF